MKKTKAIVLISGNGSNLLNIIKNVNSGFINMDIFMVISNNPKAKGLNIAENHNIPILSIDTNKKFDDLLSEIIDKNSIDLLILAGFMKILPQSITNKYDGMIINIHPSLLPKYKGLNTHERAIQNKDKFSGCTVHFVNSRLDSGKIINQKKVRINKFDTPETLKKRILIQEHKLYPAAILKIFNL